jgi:hypothetical protein
VKFLSSRGEDDSYPASSGGDFGHQAAEQDESIPF